MPKPLMCVGREERKAGMTDGKATILAKEKSPAMVDPGSFPTELYGIVNDFCQSQLPRIRRSVHPAS
jgi:hypothetical protein